MTASFPIPHNRFYNAFDCTFLEARSDDPDRTPFQRDRDRIIHSAAFRRLQGKTQVFLSGEYDFYRPRLTHSIEVAQIGRSICHYLRRHSDLLDDGNFIDPDLVEAACLAHDLGHPPFGHSGEETLHHLMRCYGGFEGNAHTLRYLTRIIYPDGEGGRVGMAPTRALLDGVLKYKTLMSELDNPLRHFIYDDQRAYLQFVFEDEPWAERLAPGTERNAFRSVECQIMDWADDTAYCLNDIVDGINARFINRLRLEAWGQDNVGNRQEAELLENIIDCMRRGTLEKTFSSRIGDFIAATGLKARTGFMSDRTRRYAVALTVDEAIRREADFYKRISVDLVFRSPQLQQLRYKWNHILQRVYRALLRNYRSPDPHALIAEATHRRIVECTDPAAMRRLLCDHLAGMTDRYVIHTYRRLFDPQFGSVGDLL